MSDSRLRTTFLMLALCGLPLHGARAMAADETGRPYLKRPALSPAALDRQVEGDRQLVARYVKHFAVAPADLRRALRHAAPDTLPPGRYTVWLTKADGLRYPTVQDRSAPTKAFRLPLPTDRDAVSWLEAGSGNPIVPFRPAEQVEVVVEPPPPRVVEVDVPREVLVPASPPMVPAGPPMGG